MFLMRFDMRAPAFGSADIRELYGAALEMAAWSEEHGCVQIVVSEHHGSEDGYLPSPLVLSAALAARTRSIALQVAALVLPLHDPVRLAEDMAILDIVSGGRLSYVLAVGYRPEEYAMFDRDFAGRGRRMDECLSVLRQAWSGEPFEYRGATLCVTPSPLTPGGPPLLMGGNSRPAARRAARFEMGMIAQGLDPDLTAYYEAECRKLGREPGVCINPGDDVVTTAFVSEDPDRTWSDIGPYMLHDARAYAAWMQGALSVTKSLATSVDELRAQNGAYRVYTPDEAIAYIRTHGLLLTQPLCGGTPPDLAWQSLELISGKVLPAIANG